MNKDTEYADSGLTNEIIRECKCFENCSDEEAVEIIETLKKFCEIVYDIIEKDLKS